MSDARVLVLYPEAFACQSKFERKLDFLLSRLPAYQLLYQADAQGFIKQYAAKHAACEQVQQSSALAEATHLLIFTDGEEFQVEIAQAKQLKLALRIVPVKITRVININKHPQPELLQAHNYEFIGRGSRWGNPYSLFDASPDEAPDTREEAIHKYQYDFQRNYLRFTQKDTEQLVGKRLGCYCKPLACHGDVLADYLNALDDGL